MNKFAGDITLKGNKLVKELEFDFIENISVNGNKVLYVSGETECKTSDELLDFFIIKFGELINYDISISSEDKVYLVDSAEIEEGLYELGSYEGENINFDEIYERFKDFDGVVSIREAEISEKFGNRVIKVDFVY